MSQEAVAKIEGVASKLIPKSPTLLYGRLFTDRDFDFFEEKGNYEEQRKALDKKRQEAVRKIITASGVDGIIEFARSAASVWKVGVALGVVGDPKVEAALLPTHLLSSDPKLQRLTASFVRGRFWANARFLSAMRVRKQFCGNSTSSRCHRTPSRCRCRSSRRWRQRCPLSPLTSVTCP